MYPRPEALPLMLQPTEPCDAALAKTSLRLLARAARAALSMTAAAVLLAACGGSDNSAATAPAPAYAQRSSNKVIAPPEKALTATPAKPATCTAGDSSTPWASACKSATPACVPGSWTIVGTGTLPPVRFQTDHFTFRWNGDEVPLDRAAEAGKTLETIWDTYINKVGFAEPFCETPAKYKINIHIDPGFGLTGTPNGQHDMAMQIGPNALLNHWGLAHAFAQTLQGATRGLRDSTFVGWMWESHANWMAHQLPEYRGDAHCSETQVNYPHLYYGSSRQHGCNWQFWEYIKDKYCYQAVNDIWLKSLRPNQNGVRNEDPFSVLARNMGWSTSQLNDVFGEWAMHNVTWDYRNPDGTDQGAVYRSEYGSYESRSGDRALRVTQLDPVNKNARRFAVPQAWAPQRWGYNIVRLIPDAGASKIDISFRGVVQDKPATTAFIGLINDPDAVPNPNSDWRWGVVAVDASGKPRYSALQRGADGELSYCLQAGDKSVWMVVMGTPKTIHKIALDQAYYAIYRFPWMAQFEGAWPSGYQPNAPTPTAEGRWHANGGGWVARGANVAASAYVGPAAQVLGGTVNGNARIEDHAVIQSGTVTGNAVIGGLTVLRGDTLVLDNARVSTVFRGPGSIDNGVVLSGSVQIRGDAEIHGVSLSKGIFQGLIEEDAAMNTRQGANLLRPPAEVTAAGPYVWRP